MDRKDRCDIHFLNPYNTFMLTTSHAILNTTLFHKKDRDLLPAILGAIIPDIPLVIYLFLLRTLPFIMVKINTELSVFHLSWSYAIYLFHSFPLLLTLVIITKLLRKHMSFVFFCSMFVHSLCDFFTHNSDANRHFFPFSYYRFRSPVSSWEPNHFGTIFVGVELVVLLFCSYYLYRRVSSPRAKAIVLLMPILHGISLVFFRTVIL